MGSAQIGWLESPTNWRGPHKDRMGPPKNWVGAAVDLLPVTRAWWEPPKNWVEATHGSDGRLLWTGCWDPPLDLMGAAAH